MKKNVIYLLLAVMLIQCRPGEKKETTISVDSWLSRVNETNTGMESALSPQPALVFKTSQAHPEHTINIDDSKQYQEMDGFGASFTEASAYLFMKALSEEKRAEVLNKLFHRESGIGLSMLRQPVGACDHVLGQYDYASVANDFELKHFDFSHEQLYVLPVLKQSLKIHPGRVKITFATWSAPAWMKTNGSFIGKAKGIEGHLRPECYDAYAMYLVKFAEAYQQEGIPVYATSMQNEPDHASDFWPAMKMSSDEQAKLIRDHLAPLITKRSLKLKIWCWDHNFDTPGYPMGKFAEDVLKDTSVAKYVAASAWHWYSGGFPEAIDKIHDRFPDKEIHFTEGSGGDWDPVKHWRDGFMTQMYYIVNLPRHHVRSIVWWNVALDENNGPDYYYQSIGSHSTCRGLVTINQKTGVVTYNTDYYSMGHISKFVDPGARRIETNQWDKALENVAFINPDSSRVLIVFNPRKEPAPFAVRWNDQVFADTLQGGAAKTYRWSKPL